MKTRFIYFALGILFYCASPCLAKFPEQGITSISPNGKYAILSYMPWYWKPPLGLLMIVTQQIPRFSKVSMIDDAGHKIFKHIETSGDWSPDSKCFGARSEKNRITLYFPEDKKRIQTTAFVWTKEGTDDIYLLDFNGLGPANTGIWASDNPKDREISLSKLNLQNPEPKKITSFTIPKGVEAIVCMKNCGQHVRLGYSYSLYKNKNPIVVNESVDVIESYQRIALSDLNLKNSQIKLVKIIKGAPLYGKNYCECSDINSSLNK